jgi:IMP cyclohydrolase
LDEDAHSSNAVDQNATFTNAQDHTLLKALQDLVVRVMDPKQTNGVSLSEYIQSQQNLSTNNLDTKPTHLGPEAATLITALQEFVSSVIVRSQSEAQNTMIEVSLVEGTH